jgi:hypothetical protein
VLATTLLLAGSFAIVIASLGYERAVFSSPGDVSDEILAELGVDRQVALRYLRAHPEAALNPPDNSPVDARGKTLSEVFADIQHRHQRDAVRRSRLISLAVSARSRW